MKTSFTVARFKGVPIQVDLSLLVLAALLAIEAIHATRNLLAGIVIGIVAALLLVASVALHELGHVAVALHYGCRVRDVTLMLIGGRATLLDMPRKPSREFWLAIAGPGVSAALWLLSIPLANLVLLPGRITGTPTLSGTILAGILGYFSLINKSLLFFNLIPAFPMDGGRILRALLARRFGRLYATWIASRIGLAAAVIMGIHGIFRGHWILVFIAYFIFQSAEAEYRLVRYEESFWR
ncbi:MAG: site-2 protease family protein [Kiritimatiellia bacterium]|jgi:Zn-dependent protease